MTSLHSKLGSGPVVTAGNQTTDVTKRYVQPAQAEDWRQLPSPVVPAYSSVRLPVDTQTARHCAQELSREGWYQLNLDA